MALLLEEWRRPRLWPSSWVTDCSRLVPWGQGRWTSWAWLDVVSKFSPRAYKGLTLLYSPPVSPLRKSGRRSGVPEALWQITTMATRVRPTLIPRTARRV